MRMPGDKMVPVTVYMTLRQRMQLDILHAATRIPIAEFVREGIELVLEKELPRWGTQLELPLVYQ
jgi:hypothetical protein